MTDATRTAAGPAILSRPQSRAPGDPANRRSGEPGDRADGPSFSECVNSHDDETASPLEETVAQDGTNERGEKVPSHRPDDVATPGNTRVVSAPASPLSAPAGERNAATRGARPDVRDTIKSSPLQPSRGARANDDLSTRALADIGADETEVGAGATAVAQERSATDGRANAKALPDRATPPAGEGSRSRVGEMTALVTRLARLSEQPRAAIPERAPTWVELVRQETHFAPVSAPSLTTNLVARQIGAAIAARSPETGPDLTGGAAGNANLAAPRRVVVVQLQPVELGTVQLRMELKGDRLTLHVVAARPETADLLQRDHAAIKDVLRAAAVNVDTVTVRAEADRTAQPHAQAQAADTSKSFSGAAMGQLPSGHHRSPDDTGRNPRQEPGADTQAARSQGARTNDGEQPDATDGLYI